MDCVSCLPVPFSGRHTHRSGQNQKPVLLRSASGAPSIVTEKLKTGRNWPLPIEQPGPAASLHLGPPFFPPSPPSRTRPRKPPPVHAPALSVLLGVTVDPLSRA